MIPYLTDTAGDGTLPIWPVAKAAFEDWRDGQPDAVRRWLEQTRFKADAGKFAAIPSEGGRLAGVVLGLGDRPHDFWAYGAAATALPAATYRIDAELGHDLATRAAMAWSLGAYSFDRYRTSERDVATLALPAGADRGYLAAAVKAAFLARDLINTPAGDMGPAELSAAAEAVAGEYDARFRAVVGDELLTRNYPAIHAVGRASASAPRLIDITWGRDDAPKVTLVGKGVCFDTGGLDIKPSSAMLKMKKDMGGAATMLGLAAMVMGTGLPVRLRVMIPAENAISGNAFRPGDVLRTRKGLTVEVGNTDAEGRLVLCDALAEADAERPDLIIDCATLTGAARVALGPDLPALFTDDDDLAAALERHGRTEQDPVWRLPLHQPYRQMLKSRVADLNNVSEGGFAGAVTAALYLKSFVTETAGWAHIDTYAWNDKARPGRPAGGEALTMRALYALLAERYGQG